jgi:hypothetical protein
LINSFLLLLVDFSERFNVKLLKAMDKDDYQTWLEMVKKEVETGDVKPPELIKKEGEPKLEKVKTEPIATAEIKKEDQVNLEKEDTVKSDPLIDQFLAEIGDMKSEAFKTSSKEQLDRLLRPGSTYFNLNPFEVLQIDPYCPVEEMRKKYRKVFYIKTFFFFKRRKVCLSLLLFRKKNFNLDVSSLFVSCQCMCIQTRTRTIRKELTLLLKVRKPFFSTHLFPTD